MDEIDKILAKLRMEQEAAAEKARAQQEEIRKQAEAQRAQQQTGLGGGMDPMQGMNIAKQFMPSSAAGGSGAAAASAGTEAGLAGAGGSEAALAGLGQYTATGTAAASGGAASGGAAAGGASSGMGGMMASAGPWAALAAAIVGHNEWAEKKGLRDGESFKGEYGLTGRALYKDKDYYAERADKFIPGLGDSVNIGASLSSPADLFRAKTWKGIGKSALKGGVVGGLLKKLF